MKDVSRNARHNERKAPILHILLKSKKYLRPRDIARLAGITNNNARRQLCKLYGQGYIYRRQDGTNSYLYRHLKRMGQRVSCELWIRLQMRKTDSSVSLNLKHKIPSDLAALHQKLEQDYYMWIWKQ